MTAGPGQTFYSSVSIETALVLDVDVERWSATVRSQHSEKTFTGVPWMALYLHPEAGEGIWMIPEERTQCLLCTPSDGDSTPFILGFLPIPDKKGSFRSNRPTSAPGDIGFCGRDGNFLYLRRGGDAQIGASPLCQMIYRLRDMTLQEVALRKSGWSAASEWSHEYDDESGQTRVVLSFRPTAEETNDPVRVVIGTPLPSDHPKKSRASSLAQARGGSGLLVDFSVTRDLGIACDGAGRIYFFGDRSYWLFSDVRVEATNIDVRTTTFRETSTTRTIKTQTEQIEFTSSIERGTTKQIFADVSLGRGTLEPTLKGDTFLRALASAFLCEVPSPDGPLVGTVKPGPGFTALYQALASFVKVG